MMTIQLLFAIHYIMPLYLYCFSFVVFLYFLTFAHIKFSFNVCSFLQVLIYSCQYHSRTRSINGTLFYCYKWKSVNQLMLEFCVMVTKIWRCIVLKSSLFPCMCINLWFLFVVSFVNKWCQVQSIFLRQFTKISNEYIQTNHWTN